MKPVWIVLLCLLGAAVLAALVWLLVWYIEQRVLAERERDEALRRCGVSQIVHFSYNDVMHPDQLRRKLEQAGVPYVS